ncbi:hypothetical protein CBOM_01093 [Ceraceosorus bombacis]|uniref:Uncharacterized protein n=1 Tax=Ceraceosorus bombacis TaxID=401625 RepID=A0A0P1BAU2_9BASI|nr:hypothetical protein CBOM_01093 [Ceraceosorus bombacis]
MLNRPARVFEPAWSMPQALKAQLPQAYHQVKTTTDVKLQVFLREDGMLALYGCIQDGIQRAPKHPFVPLGAAQTRDEVDDQYEFICSVSIFHVVAIVLLDGSSKRNQQIFTLYAQLELLSQSSELVLHLWDKAHTIARDDTVSNWWFNDRSDSDNRLSTKRHQKATALGAKLTRHELKRFRKRQAAAREAQVVQLEAQVRQMTQASSSLLSSEQMLVSQQEEAQAEQEEAQAEELEVEDVLESLTEQPVEPSELATLRAATFAEVRAAMQQQPSARDRQLSMLLFKPISYAEDADLHSRLKQERERWLSQEEIPKHVLEGPRILCDDYIRVLEGGNQRSDVVARNLCLVRAIDAPAREVVDIVRLSNPKPSYHPVLRFSTADACIDDHLEQQPPRYKPAV